MNEYNLTKLWAKQTCVSDTIYYTRWTRYSDLPTSTRPMFYYIQRLSFRKGDSPGVYSNSLDVINEFPKNICEEN